jgi:hypothetical protein
VSGPQDPVALLRALSAAEVQHVVDLKDLADLAVAHGDDGI